MPSDRAALAAATAVPAAVKARRKLQTMLLRDIARRPIQWLWRPYFQLGAINLLTGDPGVGKSTLTCEFAAIVSTGRPWPGETEARAPAGAWIMNAEDNAEDTISWRLHNQQADPDWVLVTDTPQAIGPSLAKEMIATIREHGVAAVFIDPLQSWMGDQVDMHRANETRSWAGHLRDVAQQTGCAVVLLRHRRKAAPGAGDKAIYSGLGSIDIVGFSRSEVSVTERNGVCYLNRIKGNVGRTGAVASYTIADSDEPGNDHGVLSWGSCTALPPDTPGLATATGSRTPKALLAATAWLQQRLAAGPVPSLELLQEGQDRGFSERTLKRAKEGAGAVSEQVGRGQWQWRLLPAAGDTAGAGTVAGTVVECP